MPFPASEREPRHERQQSKELGLDAGSNRDGADRRGPSWAGVAGVFVSVVGGVIFAALGETGLAWVSLTLGGGGGAVARRLRKRGEK